MCDTMLFYDAVSTQKLCNVMLWLKGEYVQLKMQKEVFTFLKFT